MKENLQELWALPFRVRPVAVIDGRFSLYSSKKLKKKFALMLFKEKITSPVAKKLVKLVFAGKITPSFVSKGMLKFFRDKLLGMPLQGVAGFYTPKTKKIYVLVDSQSNTFGFSSDKILSYTAMHECMHMLANYKPSIFWAIFQNDIEEYYDYIYRHCLEIEPGVKFEVEPIRDFLWNKIEVGWRSVSKKTVVNFGDVLQKYKKLSILKSSKFDERAEHIQFVMLAALFNPQVIQRMYFKKDYYKLFRNLYLGYKNVFNIRKPHKYTLAYQEFVIPSEIICVQAVNTGPKHYKAVNAI